MLFRREQGDKVKSRAKGMEIIMIKEEHFYFTSYEGSVRSHGMRWIPEGTVHAVLQIVHGMAEHIERYREFAVFLAERGIAVVGHDHLGHGRTAQTPEDFGYFAEKNGNGILVEDIHKVLQITRKIYRRQPYILLGHSMGSFLTRQFLCQYGKELDGVIICGTGYHSPATLKVGKRLCKSEANIYGWHRRSGLMLRMAFGSYNKKFQPIRTENDWLSRNEENVDRYEADPMCGFPFTLNGYYNLFVTLQNIINKENLARMPKQLPVFFIAGESDPVGEYGKGVRKVERLFRESGMQNVECRLYPEDRHELLNELDRERVYEDIWEWLGKNKLR